MKLHVRRGSRAHGCPLLQDEQNQTVAMCFHAEGQATAQARAETIAAAVNLLQTHGASLDTILRAVAEDETLPLWMRLGADGLRREVVGALHAGAEERGAEIDSRGDAAVARKAGRP